MIFILINKDDFYKTLDALQITEETLQQLKTTEDLYNVVTKIMEKNNYSEWRINSDGYHPYCLKCNTEPPGRKMTKYCPECGREMSGEKSK